MAFLRRWTPAIAWMLIIFIASTDLLSAQHTSRIIGPVLRWIWPEIAPATIVAVQLGVRKAAHLTEYAILAILLSRAMRQHALRWRWRAALLVIAIAACYAALDEFHQSFVASRTASIADVAIDTTGAVIGLFACFIHRRAALRFVNH